MQSSLRTLSMTQPVIFRLRNALDLRVKCDVLRSQYLQTSRRAVVDVLMAILRDLLKLLMDRLWKWCHMRMWRSVKTF